MYKVLPKTLIIVVIGWLVVGLVVLSAVAAPYLHGSSLRLSAIPGLVWPILNILLLNKLWRPVWRKFPWLQKRIFPDLNGTWNVELTSNWPRQVQLLDAASGVTEDKIDLRSCPDSSLADMSTLHLQAKIEQTWWKFEIEVTNPHGGSPIKQSTTQSVELVPMDGFKKPGINYFFKQLNDSDSAHDESEFFGSARLLYDFDTDTLNGNFWTSRKWRRAMNTAGEIHFKRRSIIANSL